jgi:hypothetical protein
VVFVFVIVLVMVIVVVALMFVISTVNFAHLMTATRYWLEESD